MVINPKFLTRLATSNLTVSTYKVALYLPELLHDGMVDFSNKSEIAKTLNISVSSIRRAVKELQLLYIRYSTDEPSCYYHCNPYLVCEENGFTGDLMRQSWNQMIGEQLQGY